MTQRPLITEANSETGHRPPAGMPQLILLVTASCLSVLGAVLIAPVLPQMQSAFAGVPGVAVLVPVVLTVPALFIGLLAPLAGVVVDLVDRKRVLMAALVVYALAGTAPLYLGSLQAILVSRAVVGICEAAIMTCCTTLIGDYWSGARRARYLSMQTLAAALAATIFLALGGALGAAGWRTPFAVYAVALLLVPAVAALIWQPAPPSDRSTTSRRLEPMPWRDLRGSTVVGLVGGVIFYTLLVELSFVLDGAGLKAPAAIGGISALMSVGTAAGCVLFARFSHRTVRSLLPTSFGLVAVGYTLVAATSAVPVITVGAVLGGLGNGLLLPTMLTWAVNRLDFQRRGRGTGLFTGVLFIGQFLCPLLIAALSAGSGGLRSAIALIAVVAGLAAVICSLTTRRTAVALNMTVD